MVLPCFVELGRPVVLPAVLPAHGQGSQGGQVPSRFPKAGRAQTESISISTGITSAVLGGLTARYVGRTRSIRSLTAVRVSTVDIDEIETEIEGDSCTPPWKSTGAAEIPDEVLEGPGDIDYVLNLEGKKVRGCLKGAKQVATLGPASEKEEMLERLFLSGVDTFRLNFSHGDYKEKTELIKKIRDVETKYRHPIGILADMQGPKPLSWELALYTVLGCFRLFLLRYRYPWYPWQSQ